MCVLSIIYIITSCNSVEGEYGTNGICIYSMSKPNKTKRFYCGNFTNIISDVKSDIQYIPLKQESMEPYIEIYGNEGIINRINCTVNYNGTLSIRYSKCLRKNKIKSVNIRIYAHKIRDVYLFSGKFWTSDTIKSPENTLTLASYEQAEFDILCHIPVIQILNQNSIKNTRINGISDSVVASLSSKEFQSSLDCRNLQYRVLNISIDSCKSYPLENYAISYAGSPEKIYYYIDPCRVVKYRGNPELIPYTGTSHNIFPE